MNIWYSYALQEFVSVFKGFAQNPKSKFIAKNKSFFGKPSTGNLLKKTTYVSMYKPHTY